MSQMGHNQGPIMPPKEEELLADLRNRFPELTDRLKEFETALADFPKELSLKDTEVAATLQDILGQIKKQKSIIAAHKKSEKAPWDKLVKVVQNFFTKNDESLDALAEKWDPVHEAYLTLKKDEARRLAEEEAERLRLKEEADRKAAQEAEDRRIAAEKAEQEAREREETARKAAEEADRLRREADERRIAAEAEERRLADEKRQRDRAEKDRNSESLKTIKRHMKDAEKLHALAEADEASPEEADQLDAMIKHGGIIGLLAGPVASSTLLDDEQRAEVEETRTRLGVLRDALNARFNKREQAKREKARLAAEAEEAKRVEERRVAREAEEKRLAEATAARLAAEKEAEDAKAAGKAAKDDARDARTDARGAAQEQKTAGKDAKQATTAAERTANQADRVERRLENVSDGELSRTRGDLGTVGSLTGSWKHYITDEVALRGACGVLGEHFTEDALSGAAYRWMVAHRAGFQGERVEGALAGVTFVWEQTSRIA